tara:strand:+ start:2334 stop:2591 length:258 start_codon:yes stop_codon:yes gene_type:complete
MTATRKVRKKSKKRTRVNRNKKIEDIIAELNRNEALKIAQDMRSKTAKAAEYRRDQALLSSIFDSLNINNTRRGKGKKRKTRSRK